MKKKNAIDCLVGKTFKVDEYGNILLPIRLCEARTRAGGSCKARALFNGRCRMHGGLSTGPKTPEGKKRSLEALARGRVIRRG